ncbi:MAG TPA: isochorismatase family protein [Alphaproteobacteria bacterium]|nr:isochorismatase family protein [Alphaproteobacteria bacterium]
MILDPRASALVVVDVQAKLAPAVAGGAAAVAAIGRLIDGARLAGVPVLATEHYPKGLGPTVPELAARLAPAEIHEKIHFDALREAPIAAALRGLDRRQLLFVGAEAHVCVLQSALGAVREGFTPFVVADAVASRTAENRAAGLDRLRGEGVRVVTAEMVLFEWAERGGTELFRSMLALIR